MLSSGQVHDKPTCGNLDESGQYWVILKLLAVVRFAKQNREPNHRIVIGFPNKEAPLSASVQLCRPRPDISLGSC